jgi:hypothetical protein
MNRVEQLSNFLLRVTSDVNLNPTHISICTALCSAWIANGFSNPFRISRTEIMTAARIKSKSTYHKIIGDLASLKYLSYNPSYHPKEASKAFIFL